MEVTPIAIGNPIFDMEGDTNVYLLPGAEPVLIDVGVATDVTRTELTAELARHEVDLTEITRVLLTHWHPDHAGLAGVVQAASGASVHVHEADAPIVAGRSDALTNLTARREASLREWGLPEPVRKRVTATLTADSGPRGFASDRPAVEPLDDGDRLSVGEHRVTAVHAPGHTAGETCFVLQRNGQQEVFTGDALLPDYTANVGGADPRSSGALAAHLDTLEHLAAGGFDRGWPGHGAPLANPGERARTVLRHHRERGGRLLDIAQDATTVWEAATALFGDLSTVHLMLGVGETHAHLEYLRSAGLVDRTDDGYVTVATGPDALATAFPEGEA